MRRIIASLAAAGVLVAGAFVASSVTSNPADAQTTDTQTEAPIAMAREEALDEVLGGLVGDGTLTQKQSDAVKDALLAKGEQLRAEREERREERQADRELIRGFLEDEVISSDELATLGGDHPFNDPDSPFADAAADGEITKNELEEIRAEHGPRGGFSAPGKDA